MSPLVEVSRMPAAQALLVAAGLLFIVIGVHGTIYRSNKRNGRRYASWNLFEDLARLNGAELAVLLVCVTLGVGFFFAGVSLTS